ncbi:dihydroorotase [Methylopila jiangsuensis]|uniref:Dihydroorotase n=1 Tax=Methylopila jiangsuensis TaxID=586230 RepID=A0A9W6JF01_9HYPH|nr:dihydroorotase [Methylopila jiangsuensis]MDR6286029.1 dihydroorotase [Methylopila jiangsuensis]GLK75787.1 dihydroorotase [Methylopila jiangsuensis]
MLTHASRPLQFVNARLVCPASGRDEIGSLLVDNGVIAEVGPDVRPAARAEQVDCGGHVLAPGLIDLGAFVGEPGAEHRETLATASRAAAAGGVTAIVARPDTTPPVDAPEIVDYLTRRARDTASVRIHTLAALTKGLEGREMTEVGLLLEAGAVAFSDGPRSVASARVMRRAMIYARDFDALICHHVEDAELSAGGAMNEGELASRLGLPGRPAAAEALVLERDVRLVALTGARYHASLITCADSVAIVADAKKRGLPVTCGVSAAHLTLNENDVGEYRTFFKLAPPLRREDDRRALVQALADGVIDVVCSGHDPQDVETKRRPFAEADDGAIGVETLLSAGLRLVHGGDVTLHRLLHAMSTRPAELLRLPGGALKVGAPADLALIDLDAPFVLDAATLKSKSKNTPFDQARLQGRALRTVVAGHTVYPYA